MNSGTDPSGPTRGARTIPLLVVSRVWEQAVLGGATLLLAARLPVGAFAGISALLVINSLSVTLSDFGLGVDILGRGPGRPVSRASLHRLRGMNAAILAIGGLVAIFLSGDARTVVAAGAAIWVLSSEAFVRKSAVIKIGRAATASGAEGLSSLIFLVAIATLAYDSRALSVTAAALIAKHLIEALCIRRWQGVFAVDGERTAFGALWSALAINYAVSNVDFIIIANLAGANPFAVYALAFRVASAVPSQLANVTSRVALVDFGDSISNPAERDHTYFRYLRLLLLAGSIGAALTAGVAPLLPGILGSRWEPVVGVIVVLCIGAPWRMVIGTAGSLAIALGKVHSLIRWQLYQLAFVTVTLTIAALISFPTFVAATTITSVATVLAVHRAATLATDVAWWKPLTPLALASIAIAAPAALLVQPLT